VRYDLFRTEVYDQNLPNRDYQNNFILFYKPILVLNPIFQKPRKGKKLEIIRTGLTVIELDVN